MGCITRRNIEFSHFVITFNNQISRILYDKRTQTYYELFSNILYHDWKLLIDRSISQFIHKQTFCIHTSKYNFFEFDILKICEEKKNAEHHIQILTVVVLALVIWNVFLTWCKFYNV